MCIADNSSRLVQNQPIITEGTGQPKTPYLHTTAGWKHFQGQHLNTPSKFSDNDGTFLCHETHSRTLSIVVAKSIADQHGRPLPVGFLHLPKAKVCCLAQSIGLGRQVVVAMVLRPTLYVSAVLVRSLNERIY